MYGAGAGTDPAGREEIPRLSRVECPFRHPVALGRTTFDRRIPAEHAGPEFPAAGGLPRLSHQFRGRRQIRLGQGVLSRALRAVEKIRGRGALAPDRQYVGRHGPERAFGGVLLPERPAGTGVLQIGIRTQGDRYFPARLFRLRIYAAHDCRPLRADRVLDPETQMAHAAFLRGSEISLPDRAVARCGRCAGHGGARRRRLRLESHGRPDPERGADPACRRERLTAITEPVPPRSAATAAVLRFRAPCAICSVISGATAPWNWLWPGPISCRRTTCPFRSTPNCPFTTESC